MELDSVLGVNSGCRVQVYRGTRLRAELRKEYRGQHMPCTQVSGGVPSVCAFTQSPTKLLPWLQQQIPLAS